MSEASYQPAARRPIASRDTRWAHGIAQRLANAGVSPNTISVWGMIFALAAGGALGWTSQTDGTIQRLLWGIGAVLVQLRLLCNLFDGMVAYATEKASPLGELYNEIPDRIADAAILVGLGYAAHSVPVYGYATAGAAIFVAYLRAAVQTAGAPSNFCGPMAKAHRMFFVTLLALFMAFAPSNWNPLWQEGWGAPRLTLVLIMVGCVVTSWRRLAHAVRALRERAG